MTTDQKYAYFLGRYGNTRIGRYFARRDANHKGA